MFHVAPPGSVCKCKVIVQADTTDDSEKSESTPHSVAPGAWEALLKSPVVKNIITINNNKYVKM